MLVTWTGSRPILKKKIYTCLGFELDLNLNGNQKEFEKFWLDRKFTMTIRMQMMCLTSEMLQYIRWCDVIDDVAIHLK
jgi:hypothetical protein